MKMKINFFFLFIIATTQQTRVGVYCFVWRVEFILKTDSGYSRDAGVFFHSRWQTLGVLSALTLLNQYWGIATVAGFLFFFQLLSFYSSKYQS